LSNHELLAIPLAQRLVWCEQVCEALRAAHQASLIHRDVNLTISSSPKIAQRLDCAISAWFIATTASVRPLPWNRSGRATTSRPN
jgi:serine/threonine protein kinase